MNTGMTTWAMSQGIPMENLEADTRIIVASPLVEVEEAVTKVNIGVTTTLHIAVHMGYEHLLKILKVLISYGEQEAVLCLRKFEDKVITTLPCRIILLVFICVLHKKFMKTAHI